MDPRTKPKDHRKMKLWGGKSSVMGEEPNKSKEWWKWTDEHQMWFLMGLPHYLRQYYCQVEKDKDVVCELEGKPCPFIACPHPHPCPHHHKCPKDKPTKPVCALEGKPCPAIACPHPHPCPHHHKCPLDRHAQVRMVERPTPVFSPIRVTGPQTYVHPSVSPDVNWYGGTSASDQSLDMIYAQIRNGRPVTNNQIVPYVPRPNSAPPAPWSSDASVITVNGQPATHIGQVIRSASPPPGSHTQTIPRIITNACKTPGQQSYVTVSTQPTSQQGHSATVLNRNSGYSSVGGQNGMAENSYIVYSSDTGHVPNQLSYSRGPYIDVVTGSQHPDIDAVYARVQPRSHANSQLVINQR